ncbi:2-hydroxychromene-2-carboxylate isomerase [Thiothrix eikelboomii]|uniref:2-hydroxychromene-2-carboxylate isomerase n=1 Tax=Thiothrix eikelboomii TaxID=92487 RepID=A0A1T4VTM3_9GAMM|nr:2-hydroxychromene-2-carboxylate isomerase [Thiothrix eikelboomii]SKA68313.1 2-hydroxychromene-2-carboxylate isomerase [Thiothrix eikelboomii]
MTKTLDFYFDFYSPYGYLAHYKIDDIAERYGYQAQWHAILLGPAFKAVGSKPLLDIPMMGAYSAHDFARTARLDGVPFVMPATFPGATLAAGRAFYWLQDQDPALAKRFAKAVFKAAFAEGQDLLQVANIKAIASAEGIDAQALEAAIQTEAVKERFKTAVQASLAKGVFGSPFVMVEGEHFWGNDRIPQVEQWLARGGW